LAIEPAFYSGQIGDVIEVAVGQQEQFRSGARFDEPVTSAIGRVEQD
jgi:hypothetical protein